MESQGEKNSSENIAAMKEIMELADEDYHSTIVFYTDANTLKNLDRGALQLNRVGLVVDVK